MMLHLLLGLILIIVLQLSSHQEVASAGWSPSSLVAASEISEDSSSAAANVIYVRIGALLEEVDHEQANMFIRTIKMINNRNDDTIRQLLNLTKPHSTAAEGNLSSGGKSLFTGAGGNNNKMVVKLEPMIEFLANKHDTLEADNKVCQFVESGVHGLFGPLDGLSIQHVQSICDNMEIPYFELRPNVGARSLHNPILARNQQSDDGEPLEAINQPAIANDYLTLNLYPPADQLTQAYIDLIYAWNWTSFAIVYEDKASMVKLQDLFRESSGSWTSKWQIKLFQFSPYSSTEPAAPSAKPVNVQDHIVTPSDPQPNQTGGQETPRRHASGATNSSKKQPSFRDIFWRIKSSGETNILLDVRTEHLYEALKNAQQVGCMTEKYSYLVTSLDLHTIDLEDFKYSRTRITSFSMMQIFKSTATETHGPQKFDEKYLEKLGVHVISASDNSDNIGKLLNKQADQIARGGQWAHKWSKYKLSPSVVLDKLGSFMEPTQDSQQQLWSRNKEQLMSSPASMGLLPNLDRDNEQKLFEFFLQQQEKNLSRVRLSTSSAVLHDSLVLYVLGLNELTDSMGGRNWFQDDHHQFMTTESKQFVPSNVSCSLESSRHTWLHGSSLVNYMRRLTFTGLTGPISFDEAGLRSNFKLDMMGVAPDIGLIKVGEWHSGKLGELNLTSGLNMSIVKQKESAKSYDELSELYEFELKSYLGQLAEQKRVLVPYRKLISAPHLRVSNGHVASGNQFNQLQLQQNQQSGLLINEIIFDRLYKEQADQVDTLIVTTKLSQPYFMLKETPNKLEGNDQYEGFAVDLIHELSKLVNFKYRWREVEDKKYGSKELLPNGTVVWNGMIGEIVRGQADLAIVDLTITAQREEAVDFTLPFMNTGISILFKKPTTKVTTLFSFLSPFSSDVWAYVLAAYCGISFVLFFVGHLSPYEWADPHPCRHSNGNGLLQQQQPQQFDDYNCQFQDFRLDKNEKILKNQFSLLNSFWFTIGSLMQQGSDLTPRSMSTRTIAGIWYFFTLIMISSYTANLAAFLTVEKVVYPIENVRDLSNQQEIKYGCVESGSTCTFFHDSQIDTYKKINETMRKFRTYVRSNDEGQKRVEEGKFAFFMESASIEYIVERNCNLTQIGGLLDSKGYGLATSKKSRLKRPYRTLLSEGILHLQETGMLHILKNRWWKERRGGGTCTDDGKGGGVTELSLANVGGVFVVLLGGLGISFLVAIAEFMWRAKRNGSTRDRMCEEMMSDLKFALACKRSTKPVELLPALDEQRGRPKQLVLSKGTRRHLARQQSSINSQQQQANKSVSNNNSQSLSSSLDPALIGTRQVVEQYGKDCDPILLHAMLTMLMQQQQQQQEPLHPSATSEALAGRGNGIGIGNKLWSRHGTGSNRVSSGEDLADSRRMESSATSLNKRRLLFAQQTIDDDQ